MIETDFAAFLQGPVTIIFAAMTAGGLPAGGRVMGVRRRADLGLLDVFVPATQWAEAVSGLAAGSKIALTFCRPSDYQTFQVKGEVRAVAPMEADDQALASSYVAMIIQTLGDLGVQRSNIEQWMHDEGLVKLTLEPDAVFTQTPGPDAGARFSVSLS